MIPVDDRPGALQQCAMLSGFLTRVTIALFTVNTALAASATYDSKDSTSPVVEIPTTTVVRESRGNITLEGPSGMFLNPTSATLPQGLWGAGFCAVLTNQDTDILGYSMYASYGVRDWLELGVVANMFDFAHKGEVPAGTYGTGGPMARVRLVRDRGSWPEISLGAYAKMGTDKFDSKNVFIAASKTVPIDEKGFVKTITFQGGFRESWLEAPDRNINRFYGGLEVQLPCNFYVVGEVSQFARRKDEFTPWAAGIQWRGKRFGLSAAIVQSGDDDPPSIYLGIGGGLGAEPVRTPTRPTSRP
ncbi:MAG: hypothetical protein QOJ87_1928 [Verrucomicrobiota bacterium]|jgi:hypothetical protein